MKKVLFYRSFRRFRGTDLKVWHYFNHVLRAPGHNPLVRLSDDTVWDDSNPWRALSDHVVRGNGDVGADVLFLSGEDWFEVDSERRAESPVPVINLIQALRHADPDDPVGRYQFLSCKAIRICVSPEIERALAATGRVRGPLYTIPNGIDLESLGSGREPDERDIDVLVVANKEPKRGRIVSRRLERAGRSLRLIDRHVPRAELLDALRRARVTVFLPKEKEGFYLPALEGMALGSVVVCPDCVGNRSFCLPGENCLRPQYLEDDIVEAAETALADDAGAAALRARAAETARAHDLGGERAAFLPILTGIDELWRRA